jgi:rod shape-determining protein MreD
VGHKELIVIGKVILVLVIAVLLQTVLLSHISILGVTADLFLIMTVIVAVSRGSLEGAVFGFFAGLVADIAYYQPLGVRAFIYVLVGYFVGMFVARFGTVNPWSVALLAGVTSFLAQFLFGLFQFIMGPRAAFITMIGTQMLPEAVLDGLITAPLYVFLVRVRLLPPAQLEAAGPRGAEE